MIAFARFILAAAAVVAVPVAVSGQEGAPPPPRKESPARRTCESNTELGSRLNRVRTCRTRAEREAMKIEARRTVDRIQALKPTFGQ